MKFAHAAATVEQDDNGNRLDVVGEHGDVLGPAVVGHVERIAVKVGDEPPVRARHRRVHGDDDRLRRAPDRLLRGGRRHGDGREGGHKKCGTAHAINVTIVTMLGRMTFVTLVATLVWTGAGLSARTAPLKPQQGDTRLLDRFFQQDDAPPLCAFRAVRHLEASNKRYNLTAWLDARTELDPAQGFRFEIIGEGGSGYIRTHVLKKALEREAMARQERELGRAALTRANYAFGESMPDQGMLRINIQPRRREEMLVDGAILVTPSEADLVRIEGRLAKNPSFWTRRVDIVRRYGRVNGVRVPIEMSSTADVLVAGHSSFSMSYEYESVNGMPVGQAAGAATTPTCR